MEHWIGSETIERDPLDILDAYPETLLGDRQRREQFRLDDQTLFLHRHPRCFSSILFYYIQGFVQRPLDMPLDLFLEECRFFAIPYQPDEDESFLLHYEDIEQPSSKRLISIFNIFFTLLSCFMLFIEDPAETALVYEDFLPSGQSIVRLKYPFSIVSSIELICTGWFLFYLIFVSPSHRNRYWDFFIDLISICPVFFSLLFYTLSHWAADFTLIHPFLICLKSFRVLRLMQLIPSCDLIRRTLFLSLNNMSIAFILTSLFLIPCAMLIFVLERSRSDSHIASFHEGLGWAIETLTTIGFGKYPPLTYQGRIFSLLLCLFGLILLALPIPIVFRKYQILYQNSLKEFLWTIYR